jgi:aryl-alcohol dehydrogenase-like predicted oxidoreductase
MNYRKLGNTELIVSEIGLGTYTVSGVYGRKNPEDIKKVILKAFELGITYIDTAPVYGDAEKLLGELWKGTRDKIVLSTKFSLIGVNDENIENYITSSLQNSLKNLETDYIDLYFVHFDSLITPVRIIVDTLDKLKKEGKIRYYGIGHINLDRINEYRKFGNISAYMIEMHPAQIKPYNKILPIVQKDNSGLIAFSTSGRGLMSGKIKKQNFEEGDIRNLDPAFYGERLKYGLRIAEKLAQIGKEYNKSAIQAGINWILSKPFISCALIGPSTIEHLKENIDSVNFKLKEDDLKIIDNIIKEEEENFNKNVLMEIEEIIKNPISRSIENEYKALIYVAEEAIDLGLADEKEILPIIQNLLFLKKMDEQKKRAELIEAKERIKSIILKNMP